MVDLLLDDYFDAQELTDFLYSQGYELVSRLYNGLQTLIKVEPLGDAIDLESLVALMRDHFYVDITLV